MLHDRGTARDRLGLNFDRYAFAPQEVPQVYAACGRGARSTLRMLRPGIAVAEVAVTELPARPTAVWTVRKTQDDAYDDLIVISFGDDKATLVLRVGDTVQEVNDSGLEGKTATLGVQLLANNSLLQARRCRPPAPGIRAGV
jgi:splicing factor 3B subunit 3